MHIPSDLLIDQFLLGPWGNYMYFIGDASTREVAIVDPAWDAPAILDRAKKNQYKIQAVLLTHGHSDHISAMPDIVEKFDIPAYISKHEHPSYMPMHKNIITVENDDIITIGSIPIKCLHTPGHTPGCQCFLYKNILLTGDTLFINGCGRCDLTGGNAETMYDTLYNIIKKLPPDTIIYSGHQYGPTPFDTLEAQLTTNPYLTCKSKKEFLEERM